MIRNAKKKIFIASFRIGDEDLFRALVDAAQRLRGGVYVITTLDEKSLKRGIADGDEEDTMDQAALNKRYEGLACNGIYVRGHSSCHAKFAVVDDTAALISTANFEVRAFTQTGEFGVVITHTEEVSRLARFFARLWHEGCEWEFLPNSDYTARPRTPSLFPCGLKSPNGRKTPEVIWTCGQEHFILREIQEVIRAAKKDLLLASFSLNRLTANPELLLAPLERAIQDNGLRVRLLVRARNHLETHREDAKELHKLGVEVFGDFRNHAKAVIADNRLGMIFSANFDAEHGLRSGVEVGIRLDNQSSLGAVIRFLEHSLEHAETELVINPNHRQLDSGLACRWRTPWPFPKALRVRCGDEIWNQFIADAEDGPVLYERSGDSAGVLYAGHSTWKFSLVAANAICEFNPENAAKPAADLLNEWLNPPPSCRNGRQPVDTKRGFCSASFEQIEEVQSPQNAESGLNDSCDSRLV
jgi:hypothetical protein